MSGQLLIECTFPEENVGEIVPIHFFNQIYIRYLPESTDEIV